MEQVVIVDGVRTPQGALGGALRDRTAHKLGEIVVAELLKRTGIDPNEIDETIVGCVGQSSDAPNIARVIALKAGIPKEKPAYTVARNCASGIQAIVNAYQAIQCGDGEVYMVAGVESMSSAPFVNRDIRFGKKLQHSMLIDTLWEGLTDPVCGQIMGRTAENLAEEFKLSREEQDTYAITSHKKAFKATREGRFKEEIVPVQIEKKVAGKVVASEPFSADEGPNIALNAQTLALYPTIFKENGTVTPGNACPISDGAAAVLVMTAKKAKALNLTPLGTIRSYAFAALEPERMGLGPAYATPIALKRAGIALSDLQLIEVNEAFAAQYLSVERSLGLNRDIVNVNGGAIALGHPVGATGVRITLTLLKEMKRRELSLGLATLCVGGGLGASLVVERA
ncbi:MAG: thiolase family protein [Candidatus Wallbacteria bacterium]|nr:thiolase family protein [Candidatus Wallbacteria bacterium]